MIKQLMRKSNIFAFDNFWKADGNMSYSSACGGLVSLPLLVLIGILFVLKIIQMVNYGIVLSQTQVNYSVQPPLTTISTNLYDGNYAPFMVAFAVNLDNSSCPNSFINYQAFVYEVTGAYNTTNRTSSKVPLNFEICNDSHFGMLPGKLNKVKEWAATQLYCLPSNAYFQIGGSQTYSDLYKNIQFKFNCPSGCSAAICGYVQFYSASSTINLGNATNPYSYGLTRNLFSVESAPKYQISYQIDTTNMTSDNSIFPFSIFSLTVGASLGNVFADIPVTAGDTSTYVTLERSDKSTIYQRSYYKIFDLVAYMGGVIYGTLVLLFFIKNFSQIEFQLNFAAQYFRVADSKFITFRGYLKQLFYQIFKNTRFQPDWKMAAQRQQSREAANRVLDVIYLNKRIAFLQQAISLIFQRHQMKGIHLLHNLNKQQVRSKINAHRLRDRLVYFLGKKYKHRGVAKQHIDIRFQQNDSASSQHHSKKLPGQAQIQPKMYKEDLRDSKDHVDSSQQQVLQIKFTLEQNIRAQQKSIRTNQGPKALKMTLRNLLVRERQNEENNLISDGLIINQADKYYSQLAQSEKRKKTMVNSKEDNRCLKNELNFVGDLSYEEFNELELMDQLITDMKKLVEEAQSDKGSEVTKKIYSKLDEWLKNYLKDTLRQMDRESDDMI